MNGLSRLAVDRVLVFLSLSSGVRLAVVTVICSSSFLSSRYFSLTAFSINGLQLLISFAVVLHSPPTLPRYLAVCMCIINNYIVLLVTYSES